MKSNLVHQITLYKYRYWFGYGALLVFVLAVTTWQFWALPSGLSEAEMTAASVAGHFSPAQVLDNVVNLPWTVLEWLSIKAFGVTTLAFRLPAVILMILTAVGLVLILRRWTRRNIAVISGFWAITSIPFISLARSGTPAAMTTFLLTVVLLAALTVLPTGDKAAQPKRPSWQTLLVKIVLGVALALLCYQVAGIYLVAVLLVVGALHPKTRLIFLRTRPWRLAVGALAGLAVVTPLIIGLVAGGSAVVKDWLALSGAWSLDHLSTLGLALVGSEAGSIGGLMVPLTALVAVIIAALGLLRVATDILSARSYLVVSLLLVALVLSAWQPALIYLLFVPLALLVTVGIEVLIRGWYSLFPRNPYARVLAVVPLTFIIAGLGWTSIACFSLAQNYSPAVVYSYSQGLEAVRGVLGGDSAATLVVTPEQQSFYQILQRDFPKVKVATEPSKAAPNIVITPAATPPGARPNQLVTNWHADDAVILRVY